MSPVSSVASWFFSSFGWKVPMPMRSFSRQVQALHAHVVGIDLAPVAVVALHQALEDEAARRIEIAFDPHAVAIVAETRVGDRGLAPLFGDQAQRLLVHRAREHAVLVVVGDAAGALQVDPVNVYRQPALRARVGLEALLEQARDRALRRADRTVQQDDAPLRAVALRGGLQHVHEPHQWDVEPVDRVLAVVDRILEERVTDEALLAVDVLVFAVADDHVVDTLERVARHFRPLLHDAQVVFERAFPVQVLVALVVLQRRDPRNQGLGRECRHVHLAAPRRRCLAAANARRDHRVGRAGARRRPPTHSG